MNIHLLYSRISWEFPDTLCAVSNRNVTLYSLWRGKPRMLANGQTALKTEYWKHLKNTWKCPKCPKTVNNTNRQFRNHVFFAYSIFSMYSSNREIVKNRWARNIHVLEYIMLAVYTIQICWHHTSLRPIWRVYTLNIWPSTQNKLLTHFLGIQYLDFDSIEHHFIP